MIRQLVGIATLVSGLTVPAHAIETPPRSDAAPATRDTLTEMHLGLGLQLAPKATDSAQLLQASGPALAQPNPFLSQVTDLEEVDLAGWRDALEATSDERLDDRRAARAKSMGLLPPLSTSELEPENEIGFNDNPAAAQRLTIGGASLRTMATVTGSLPTPVTDPVFTEEQENNDSIPEANPVSVSSDWTFVDGDIGNGANGSAGTGTGDVDFFSIDLEAGESLLLSTVVLDSFDSVIVVYDSRGVPVAANDDDPARPGLASGLVFQPESTGTYHIMVAGFTVGGSLPGDPFDGSAGPGRVGSEGEYLLIVGNFEPDIDYYSVFLDKGELLGVTVAGAGQRVDILDQAQVLRASSAFDLSALYPDESPLPGGGNATVAYQATRPGLHYVAIGGNQETDGLGQYLASIERHRPGIAIGDGRPQQNIFIDFDGATIAPATFGQFPIEPVQLSPMRAFLANWGLDASDEDAVIDATMETLRENLRREVISNSGYRGAAVSLRNSRDNAIDPFGQSNVARVTVGGTVNELGIDTIGQAAFIDPGNFDREDEAVVLLDKLSGPFGEPISINTYLSDQLPREERIEAIGRSVGNIIAHEVGHLMGNFHTDPLNGVPELMDMGGDITTVIGAGPDRLLGTADDVNMSFGTDVFSPIEGLLIGRQNSAGNVAYGLDSEAKRQRLFE